MSKPRKIGRLAVFAVGCATLFLFATASRAEAAASLYLAPPSGTFIVGNTFTVSVYVNTGGQSINAVRADLSFPPDKLQIVSPTTGKSFIQIWVSQPTYSNEDGTMTFQGTIPTPGIMTDAGLISTVTFRVKAPGTAAVRILDTSQVLLNDGRGTNILGQTTDGIYYLTLPPPEGPIVTSRTNPDQEKWYAVKTVTFEWTSPTDIQGYSYTLDQDPAGEPDDVSEGTNTEVAYNNLADGVYYFHIKSLRQGAWGGITDYVVHIDNTPPAVFTINISPSDYTSNQRPIIDFGTTDQTSGMDHYELKIVALNVPAALTTQDSTPFFIEVSPPYSMQLAEGSYNIIARAYDEAGNYYQAEQKLSVVKPVFEIIAADGLRIGGVYTMPWPYVGIIGAILLAILLYFGRLAWIWHREVERMLEKGALAHPAIAPKLEELRTKQKEYGSPRSGPGEAGPPRPPRVASLDDKTDPPHNGRSNGGEVLPVLFLFFALAFGIFAAHSVFATGVTSSGLMAPENVPLEPPVITMFPRSISNDEILYIGGRAGAPDATVLIYIQEKATGESFTETAMSDENGSWFYSLPQFLNAGDYMVWTQLKVADELSAPSSRMDLTVAPTAIQIGGNRLSYENLYLILFIVFLLALLILIIFFSYHTYHFRAKNRRLAFVVREAEESIRRGFSILHHDIESELGLIHKAKLSKELSVEEKLREEKLLKDLDTISSYIGKEVWKVEEAEKEL